MFWIGIFVGMIVGSIIGVFIMSLCTISKEGGYDNGKN